MTAPVKPGPSPTGGGPVPYLTKTQHLVLHRLAAGATCRKVAAELGVSEVTVRGYSHRAQDALGARTIAHAVHIAHQLGLLDDMPQETNHDLRQEEVEVLRLMASGRSNAQIAALLHRPEYTVADQVRRLRNRLGARDRSHAVAIGMAREILRPEDIDGPGRGTLPRVRRGGRS